jgi:hypothetical protein
VNELIDTAKTVVLLVIFTSPIWYPIYAVSRLEREVRRHNRDRKS